MITTKIRREGNTTYLSGNPVGGLIGTVAAFTETLGVGTPDTFTEKQFRYTLNGVEWSDWQNLTIENITAIEFGKYNTLAFEFLYIALPATENPEVTVEVELDSTVAPIITDIFHNTIFKTLFDANDERVLGWTLAVLKKMYEKGLLVPFIGRKNNEGTTEDFVAIFKTICQYFALYVIYMREYEKFYENRELLVEYLTQRGLTTSPNDSLEELYLMMRTFHKQVADRGSIKIIDNKPFKEDVIDGEFMRLIQWIQSNEFLFNLHKTSHFGWNLGNSSPLYRGLYIQDNLVKSPVESTNIFTVNSALDYEVTFIVKTAEEIDISFVSKDIDGNTVTLRSAKTGSTITKALSNQEVYRSDKDILIRVCIYNSQKTADSNDTLNINLGNNIILHEDSRTLSVVIKLGGVSQDLKDSNTRFLPLFTPYSHGLIQVYNWISCWIENNNLSLTRDEIQAYARKYLIPYNSTLEIIEIGKQGYYNGHNEPIHPPTVTFGWRPVQGVCEYVIETKETKWVGNPINAYCEQE